MSAFLSNGARLFIGTLGTSKTMSAITNASQAVATLEASHGITTGDMMLVKSGWGLLNDRLMRADAVSTNDVTFEDFNSTSTTDFPAGAGTGSVQEATFTTQITQVTDAQFSGGDAEFAEYKFLEDPRRRRISTGLSAEGLDLTIAHDPTLSWYSAVRAASKAGTALPFKILFKSGAVNYYYGTLIFNESPTLSIDEVQTVRISISFDSELTTFAS